MEIKDPVDPTALAQAKAIMDEIRPTNDAVLLSKLVEVAQRLGDIPRDSSTLIKTKEECKAAFESLTEQERTALVNIHARVKFFAEAQRASVQDIEVDIPGGKAGHTVSPCKGKKQCCVVLVVHVVGIVSTKYMSFHCTRV
jgi:histidinol dehydrogenase